MVNWAISIAAMIGARLQARAGQVALTDDPSFALTPPSHQNQPPEMIPVNWPAALNTGPPESPDNNAASAKIVLWSVVIAARAVK